jgi:hypothetical protein
MALDLPPCGSLDGRLRDTAQGRRKAPAHLLRAIRSTVLERVDLVLIRPIVEPAAALQPFSAIPSDLGLSRNFGMPLPMVGLQILLSIDSFG